jgi:glucose-1-phosphate thymidylyltransferase
MRKVGIALAGGKATRLFPITKVVSKQLLHIYKKPVIAYPLHTLQKMGYSDILIITANEKQQEAFIELLGDGSRFGLNLSYKVQGEPRGLSDAFIVGEEFIGNADEICLILGDNIILGDDDLSSPPNTIFTYKVRNPSQYGVATLDKNNKLLDIVEKPKEFVSENAVIGLYVFSKSCVEAAKSLKPSGRGEIEIVDLIKILHEKEGVNVRNLDGVWLDIGDFDSLLDAGNLVRTLTNRTTKGIGLRF